MMPQLGKSAISNHPFHHWANSRTWRFVVFLILWRWHLSKATGNYDTNFTVRAQPLCTCSMVVLVCMQQSANDQIKKHLTGKQSPDLDSACLKTYTGSVFFFLNWRVNRVNVKYAVHHVWVVPTMYMRGQLRKRHARHVYAHAEYHNRHTSPSPRSVADLSNF